MTGKKTMVEFIESYIKHGAGDYEWYDNHGELIRCKDCEYKECLDEYGYVVCDKDGSHHPKEWFCADGERTIKND